MTECLSRLDHIIPDDPTSGQLYDLLHHLDENAEVFSPLGRYDDAALHLEPTLTRGTVHRSYYFYLRHQSSHLPKSYRGRT